MTFLPVVERELRTASRRRATYRLRVLGAMICLGVTAWRVFSLDQLVQSQQGRALFLLLLTLSFVYCLFAGFALTADCLSVEKREGTIGLLFLTDLRSHELILGKLAANSIGAVYGLLAILPVLAISLTFGGVTGGEYIRAALMLVNTLFLSLSTGILMSAFCHHERNAFVGAFFIIFISIAGPLVITFLFPQTWGGRSPSMLLFSPIYSFLCLRIQGLPFPSSFFWWSLLSIHTTSWTFLILAGQIQKRTWQDRPKGEKRTQWHGYYQALIYGAQEHRIDFRTRMLNFQPLLWFNTRNRLKPAAVWFFLMCMGILWIWDCSQLGSFMWEADHCLIAVLLVHSIIKIWIGVESCSRFADEQQSGALELLLTSPLKQTEFFEAHFQALKRQFALPMGAVLTFDIFVLFRVESATGFWNVYWLDSLTMIRFALLTAMILFVVDFFALCWIGVWEGLFARSTNRALAVTISKVLILPWIIVVGIWVCSGLILRGLGIFGMPQWVPMWMFLSVFSWLITGVLFSFYLQNRMKAKLSKEFRRAASERFQSRETGRGLKVDRRSESDLDPPSVRMASL